MEILRLVGILLLIILLIVVGSKVVYKDNFAIIEGKITASQTGIMQNNDIAYPSGFNRDNCIVLTAMLSMDKDSEESKEWGYGNVFNSGSYVRGALPLSVGLSKDDISINFRNMMISESGINEIDFTTDFYYKIVLMKIGD